MVNLIGLSLEIILINLNFYLKLLESIILNKSTESINLKPSKEHNMKDKKSK